MRNTQDLVIDFQPTSDQLNQNLQANGLKICYFIKYRVWVIDFSIFKIQAQLDILQLHGYYGPILIVKAHSTAFPEGLLPLSKMASQGVKKPLLLFVSWDDAVKGKAVKFPERQFSSPETPNNESETHWIITFLPK